MVQTLTGDGFGSGTDAKVYVSLIGTIGDSGKRFLVHNLEKTDDKFESGQVIHLYYYYSKTHNEYSTFPGC